MKKTLAFVAIMVLVVSAFSLGFTDVGEDHWAYDYVMKLVEKGVIPVDEPTFRGYEPLTRSDAAVWMSRLVTYLENSPEIAKTRDLNYLEEKVNNTSKKVNTVESKVNSVESNLNALSEELNETKQLAQENNMFVKALPALSTKVVAIERKVNATENKVAELEKFRTTMAQQHLNLKYDTYDKIDALDNQVALNEEMIVSLTQELESVKATSDQNAMFVKAMPNLATKTASNEAKILELNQEVSSLNEKVSSMESALNQNDLLADLQATYFDVKKTAYRAKNIGDSLEKDLLAISQEVSSLNEEIAKAQDNTMLWLVAGLGVVLGVVGIFLP